MGTNIRVNDGAVFAKSALKREMDNNLFDFPQEGVFVVDDAFPLTTRIIKPYSRCGPLTLDQRVANYRISRACKIVENAFDILVSKFRIYEKAIDLGLKTTEVVVKTTCTIHNWLRKTSNRNFPYTLPGMIDDEAHETGCIISGSWRQGHSDGLVDVVQLGASNNHTRAASAKRDQCKQLFVTSEAVPWQLHMI